MIRFCNVLVALRLNRLCTYREARLSSHVYTFLDRRGKFDFLLTATHAPSSCQQTAEYEQRKSGQLQVLVLIELRLTRRDFYYLLWPLLRLAPL